MHIKCLSCHKPVLLCTQRTQGREGSFWLGQSVIQSVALWCSIVEKHRAVFSVLSFYSPLVLMDAMLAFLWNPPTHCTCRQPGRQEGSWSFCDVASTGCVLDKNFDTMRAGSQALEGTQLWERWNGGWSGWNMHEDCIYPSSYCCMQQQQQRWLIPGTVSQYSTLHQLFLVCMGPNITII